MIKLLWKLIWNRYLTESDYTVVKVKGWRSALIETKYGSRKNVTICFTLFGIKFD
jgi:hypothetical protein